MKKLVSCIVVLCILLLSGCVEKTTAVNGKDNRDYLVYGVQEIPKDLSGFSNEEESGEFLLNLFEGLVKVDNEGKIVPATAEGFEKSKDELTYTFKIRAEAAWSDGKDITAKDYVDFFCSILKNKNENQIAHMLYCISGAENYNKGKGEEKDLGIKAINLNTLEIKLNSPCNYFLNLIAQPNFALRKIDNNLKEYHKQYKNIAFTGPYKVVESKNNSEITFEKNPAYWNSKEVRSNKLVFSKVESAEAALAAFENSKIDVFKDPPEKEKDKALKRGSLNKVTTLKAGALIFNTKGNDLCKNKYFREAAALTIDRNNILKDAFNNNGEVSTGIVPFNINTAVKEKYIGVRYFNPESLRDKSKELLSKNKINNKDKLNYVYINSLENSIISNALVKEFKKSLGIQLIAEGYNKDEFYKIIKEGGYDIAQIEYLPMYDYPLSYIEKISDKKLNYNSYTNKDVDIIINKLKIEKNPYKKLELLISSETLILNEGFYIPLYFKNINLCKSNDVENITVDKFGNIDFQKAFLNLQNR